MLSLKQGLEILNEAVFGESPKTFSIEFGTCNRDKKSGGDILNIAKAQKHGLKAQSGYKYMLGIYDHETGRRIAVHERLIFKINGQEIYW
ncbi:MAG: hypothetical protein H7Y13_11845 [Sphingobacteriaceae bacterium]|nr:hypothetical protein [Sphingobacteriaceae bacterium]